MKEEENIDKLIRETLSDSEAKFYDDLEEKNLMGKLVRASKGKTGWLVVTMSIVNLLIFVLFVYCIIQFFKADEIKVYIKWACGAFLAFTSMGMMKLYVWMQMDKNDLLREIKRLELQISSLSSRIIK